jgi:hypothetical protein
MSDNDAIGPKLEIAERLIAEKFAGANVEKAEELSTRSRARVSRLWLADAKPPVPSTLICKYPFDKTQCAYDEWTGLQFLTQIANEAETAPKFLAGDEDSGLILLQDLGDVQDLGSLQVLRDENRYNEECVNLARLTATMHSCAAGIEETYSTIRKRLPMAGRPVRFRQADDFRATNDKIIQSINLAGVSVESGFHDEIEIVARTIEDPGPFLAFTHGDMAPSNCLFTNLAPFLIDFEWSGYRHALYDALFWHIIFPFPEAVIKAMDSAYRRIFGQACRIALDDAQYEREMAKLCAHHMLSFVGWWFPKILEEDGQAAPGVSRRQMILFKLQRFGTLNGLSALPAMRSTLARLTRELHKAWPDVSPLTAS